MDLSLLFCGFVFGVIGMWMFRQGKKNANIITMAISVTLMIYHYFIESVLVSWLLGVALCFLAYFKW